MAVYKIDGVKLRDMFSYGVSLLEANKQAINQLNVFPVPDGDTGTNMSLTALSAYKGAQGVETVTAESVAQAIAKGALKGARGNSGVILSQLFRGFSNGIAGSDTVDAAILATALAKGVETAYKAVMKPREGTILTVARACAEAAVGAQAGSDIVELFEKVLSCGKKALDNTPNQLEVLKKAGVVDAGGMGLITIYTGFLAELKGQKDESVAGILSNPVQEQNTHESTGEQAVFTSDQEIEFGYCTEFIIDPVKEGVKEEDALKFREELGTFGDCAVVVFDTDMIKVHVHSNAPDKVLGMALQLGELDSLKIENMRVQHREMLGISANVEKKQEMHEHRSMAIVSVASGEGMQNIFRDIMVDSFVEGGQTMNPSAEDIADAVTAANADMVFVLPNNSNIILAAQQAAELSMCNVVVIPTKTMPQGIAAALVFDSETSVEQNTENMTDAISKVFSGQITYAVRDSEMDGHSIKEGDIIGINEHGIECVGRDINDTAAELIRCMTTEHKSDMISVYYGADIDEKLSQELKQKLVEAFPQHEVEVYAGGQPVYYYIVSVE